MQQSIAVIDVETTGLYPRRNDRIVEIAAVIIGVNGCPVREFVTLINPLRDVGPTRIHGITATDVIVAPTFVEIASLLIEAMDGVVAVAAHNARFDRGFLEAEFVREGLNFPRCEWLCTLQLTGGGTLAKCAQAFGIPLGSAAHTAIADARAAAGVLAKLLQDDSALVSWIANLQPISWPEVKPTLKRPVPRANVRQMQGESPGYLQQLVEKAHDDLIPCTDNAALIAYSATLTRAMEDNCISDDELAALSEVALDWGLDRTQVSAYHREYLLQLTAAALTDGVVSESERQKIIHASYALGVSIHNFDKLIIDVSALLATVRDRVRVMPNSDVSLIGKSVCFTGEYQCLCCGQWLSRMQAESLATKAGLKVARSVTKKLDLLVVADPYTQSGKAVLAKRYGIRVMHGPVFWRNIGMSHCLLRD